MQASSGIRIISYSPSFWVKEGHGLHHQRDGGECPRYHGSNHVVCSDLASDLEIVSDQIDKRSIGLSDAVRLSEIYFFQLCDFERLGLHSVQQEGGGREYCRVPRFCLSSCDTSVELTTQSESGSSLPSLWVLTLSSKDSLSHFRSNLKHSDYSQRCHTVNACITVKVVQSGKRVLFFWVYVLVSQGLKLGVSMLYG